jgi:hypothetical protein
VAALLRTLAGSGRNVQSTAAPVHSLRAATLPRSSPVQSCFEGASEVTMAVGRTPASGRRNMTTRREGQACRVGGGRSCRPFPSPEGADALARLELVHPSPRIARRRARDRAGSRRQARRRSFMQLRPHGWTRAASPLLRSQPRNGRPRGSAPTSVQIRNRDAIRRVLPGVDVRPSPRTVRRKG